MKKALCAITMLAVMLVASPVLAQGPFTDVPTDHWAYEAVTQLAEDGIIVGYPDGTFGGKRAMTRFEFAQALARAIPVIVSMVSPGAPGVGVSPQEFNALRDRVSALEARPEPTVPPAPADVDALRRLVEEFRDELAAMGVDVDALRRDVAALSQRVAALEDEVSRVKIIGDANAWASSDDVDLGAPLDRDERAFQGNTDLLEGITYIKEIDLNITGRAGRLGQVVTLINAGNYLNYLGAVDDYVTGLRPTDPGDSFTPYYLYMESPFLAGAVTVGRFPLQWTPYTLRKIDVDSYTVNRKTDSGDYPLDGIKGSWRWGGVGVEAFAAKTENALLANGLTAQPTIGLYNDVLGFGSPFHAVGGHAMGGLESINQAAGARLMIGTPFAGNLGLTYIEAASSDTVGFDAARLMGADVNFNLGNLAIGGSWTETRTDAIVGANVTDDNTALDANVGFGIGGLGIKAGWKSIERNFAAPGFWDKLGRWTNPTNVEGWYADLNYGLGANLSLVAGAQYLSGADDFTVGPLALPAIMNETEDDIRYLTAGLRWGLSATTSVDLGWERVRWQPSGATTTDERYINIGFGYQFSPNMAAKVLYQIADYEPGTTVTPYGLDAYEGNKAVAQFSVKF